MLKLQSRYSKQTCNSIQIENAGGICRLDHLLITLVQQGFWYHHAEPTYLMLAYWIPETAHTLPANASHTVGIGALVMNDKREVR